MNAKEFLIEISPNDSCGIREKLEKSRLRGHIENIMERYALLKIEESWEAATKQHNE